MEYTAHLLHESKMKAGTKQFLKKNLIFIIILVFGIIWTYSIRAISYHNAYEDAKVWYGEQLEEYKAEMAAEVQKEYWLSGEASLEAQINREATLICKGNGIWTTDEARYGYWCNVWIRVLNPEFPDSVEEVLTQPGQYAFWDKDAPVDEAEHAKCVELLKQLHNGVLPAHLTVKHRFLEMRDNGAVCVLHTEFNGGRNDDPWRWRG